MDEVPDRPIVHLETALGKLRHKTPQREGLFPSDAIAQKDRILIPDRLRLVSAHLAGREAARFPNPPHPVNDRARRNAKMSRRPDDTTARPASPPPLRALEGLTCH